MNARYFTDPWTELNRLSREMDRLFGRRVPAAGGATASFPAMNMWEDNEHYFLEAELPGFEMNAIELMASEGNQLTISGERQPPAIEGGTWHRRERGFGRFNRIVTLPAAFNADKVQAQLRDGVLLVKLPKAEEAKPRRIEVKAG